MALRSSCALGSLRTTSITVPIARLCHSKVSCLVGTHSSFGPPRVPGGDLDFRQFYTSSNEKRAPFPFLPQNGLILCELLNPVRPHSRLTYPPSQIALASPAIHHPSPPSLDSITWALIAQRNGTAAARARVRDSASVCWPLGDCVNPHAARPFETRALLHVNPTSFRTAPRMPISVAFRP